MSKILQPLKFEHQLEYRVQKGKEVYIAGASHAHIPSYGAYIFGNVYLKKVEGTKKTSVFRPNYPFPIITQEEREVIIPQFYLKRLILSTSYFENLSENINIALMKKKGLVIDFEDARTFFLRIQEYYSKITKAIEGKPSNLNERVGLISKDLDDFLSGLN
ncbi:hypothetical protein J4214_03040 [Candidatus Woesearchaeota archaeon]|nr:hypothetical protein [Candidatus Woesearchaeota archaeon]